MIRARGASCSGQRRSPTSLADQPGTTWSAAAQRRSRRYVLTTYFHESIGPFSTFGNDGSSSFFFFYSSSSFHNWRCVEGDSGRWCVRLFFERRRGVGCRCCSAEYRFCRGILRLIRGWEKWLELIGVSFNLIIFIYFRCSQVLTDNYVKYRIHAHSRSSGEFLGNQLINTWITKFGRSSSWF